MASAGVDGVNIHTWSGSAGKLFSFSNIRGAWSASVEPEYYGLLMFAQAAPLGSQLLSTTESNGGDVHAWAFNGPDHTLRVVLVNNSLTGSRSVLVRPPTAPGAATIERLSAPSPTATTGVTLGCQSFGAQTTNGLLQGTPCLTPLAPTGGNYGLQLPAASAVLLAIPAASGPTTPSGATTPSGSTTPTGSTAPA
jgi:mucin-2